MNRTWVSWSLVATLLLSVCGSGCVRSRTVLVPPGQPVMLAEDIEARIRYYDNEGRLIESPDRVILPEGWWCLPDPDPGGE